MRSVVALALAAFVWLAPGYRQVLHERTPWVPRWVMFQGKGLGFLEVRYIGIDPRGQRTRLDRFEVLGHAGLFESPKNVRRIDSLERAEQVARKLCSKLEKGTRVQLYAREARRGGWKKRGDPGKDQCAPRPKLKKQPGKRGPK